MAGLLEFIGQTRGKLQGYRDTTRAKILQPVLDQIAQAEQSRAMNQNQQAYGKAAAALGLNTPDVGFLALLARADPTAASGLLSQAAQARSPMGQEALDTARLGNQTQRFSNLLAGVGEQRAQAQERRNANRNSLLNRLTGLQIQQAERANQPPPQPTMGQQLTQTWEAQTGVPVPKDFRVQPRFTPDGQPFLDVQPVEGTAAYNGAVDAIRGGEEAVKLIEDMLDDLALYGTEKGGAKAAKMRQRRDRIIGYYAQLQNLGVLQPGEVERLDAVLPDPTSFGAQLNPMAAQNIAQTYEQLKNQVTDRLMTAREKAWFVPFQAVTPEEQAGAR